MSKLRSDILEPICEAWCKTLLSESVVKYDEMLSHGDPKQMLPEFSGGAAVYQSLEREHQMALLELFKVVAVDTASQLLGNLDGSSYIEGVEGDFSVRYDGDDVTGYLQECFLGTVEDSGYIPRK
ncbi:hypothetical protein [Stenotrophomonas sp.]|uniref:hypothetical protein n=1 Tax=Stenotrophomonas sp. TaxID=69392 RepID=UPI00289E7847|nr:hypothetical protein [Stenotrophomonas sp.]